MNFAEFVRVLFLWNTIGRLLLITAVSIVVKEELTNETVNCDTKTKAYLEDVFKTSLDDQQMFAGLTIPQKQYIIIIKIRSFRRKNHSVEWKIFFEWI